MPYVPPYGSAFPARSRTNLNRMEVRLPDPVGRPEILALGLSARALGIVTLIERAPAEAVSLAWLAEMLPADAPWEIAAACRELRRAGLLESAAR